MLCIGTCITIVSLRFGAQFSASACRVYVVPRLQICDSSRRTSGFHSPCRPPASGCNDRKFLLSRIPTCADDRASDLAGTLDLDPGQARFCSCICIGRWRGISRYPFENGIPLHQFARRVRTSILCSFTWRLVVSTLSGGGDKVIAWRGMGSTTSPYDKCDADLHSL